MSNQLIVAQASKLAGIFGIPEQGDLVSVLKATAFRGKDGVEVTDAQLTALLIVANQYRLNPWTKEIYAFPDKNNGIVPVVGIDGWARIINENAQFDGMDFTQSEEMVRMPGAKSDAPAWLECTMYRKDRTRPVIVREYLDEVYREPFKGKYGDVTGPWQTHPKRFLRHKAMIQCARLAFGYVGIYDQDEAERIAEAGNGRREVDITPTKEAPPEVVSAAREAANKGLDSYMAYWQGINKETRALLVDSGVHTECKEIAGKVIVADEFVAQMDAAEASHA